MRAQCLGGRLLPLMLMRGASRPVSKASGSDSLMTSSLRVAADETGSRIDMRSTSRQGRSDYGVNAARIRTYMGAFASALARPIAFRDQAIQRASTRPVEQMAQQRR